jgi:hypothetical protein
VEPHVVEGAVWTLGPERGAVAVSGGLSILDLKVGEWADTGSLVAVVGSLGVSVEAMEATWPIA